MKSNMKVGFKKPKSLAWNLSYWSICRVFEKWISCFTPFQKQCLAEVRIKWRESDNTAVVMKNMTGNMILVIMIISSKSGSDFSIYLVYLYILFTAFIKNWFLTKIFESFYCSNLEVGIQPFRGKKYLRGVRKSYIYSKAPFTNDEKHP